MADRETDQPADTTSATTADAKSDDELGSGGKRALESERTARREAERKLQKAEARIQELELQDVRREIAASKGLSETQAKFLAGSSKEELEASADELLDAFGTRKDEPGKSLSKPREKLRSGASNEDDAAPSASAIADKILAKPF